MPETDRRELPKEKVMVTRHALEVRHEPSGTFLDVRGYVADFVRTEGFLPHWQIEANAIQFRDLPDRIKQEGAFVGYKSIGYSVTDSPTRNYFYDKASAFWKLLLRNKTYQLPALTRFGCRTLAFIPSNLSFDELRQSVVKRVFSGEFRGFFGTRETDLQFVIEFNEGEYKGRISGGPVHTREALIHMGFESKEFEKCGLFLDLDYYKMEGLEHSQITRILHDAVELSWAKIETIANSLGL